MTTIPDPNVRFDSNFDRSPLEVPAAGFSLKLSDDQKDMQTWARDFAERVLRPAAAEWDQKEQVPWPVLEEAAKIGLYDLNFYHEVLKDTTGLTLPIVIEELFAGDAGLALAITGTMLALMGLAVNGTGDQINEWSPKMFGEPGDIKLGAFCLSEPEAGSDAANLRTTAKYNADRDTWTLNGLKTWITNGGIADVHIVVATVDKDLRFGGQATFVIPRGTKGLEQGAKIHKLGIRASHTAEVILTDCEVPASALLGGKDALDARLAKARERLEAKAVRGSVARRQTASPGAVSVLEATRPAVAAQALGIARAALEEWTEYAKSRTQFGRPLIENQMVYSEIAQLSAELDAARLLTWRAANMSATGQTMTRGEGSMSKLLASQLAVRVTTAAVRGMGGMGFVEEGQPTARRLRDAQIMEIYEGTSNTQKMVIGRAVSGIRNLH